MCVANVRVVERHTRESLAGISQEGLKFGGHTQLQNATKNPNQANVNTRPYILMGLSPGIERAFRLTGLTTGALHNVVISYIIVGFQVC